MLWLGGTRYNAVATGAGVTASPSADSLFPTTKLYDGYPGDIFKFGSLSASPTLTVDLDMFAGAGGFENWTGGAPIGWTEANAGTGDVTQQSVSGTLVHSGLFSARLAAGDTSASIYYDLTVRAGQRLAFTIALRGDGLLGAAQLAIRNQQTGNYLGPSNTWGSAFQEVIIGPTAAAYTVYNPVTDPNPCIFDVEGYETVGGPLTTIRIQLFNDRPTTIGWADTFSIWPAINFCSVHGHNIDPRSTPVVRASTDNFSGSNVSIATPTVVDPAFHVSFSSQTSYRYWRLAFADTNSSAIYVGEWVLGTAATMSAGPAYPYQPGYSAQQVRVPRRFGAPNVYAMGSYGLRSIPLKILCRSMAERTEFFQEWNRCLDGTPVVVVPYSGTGHTDVVLGILPETMDHSWQVASASKNVMDFTTIVTELPLPLVIG